MPVWAWILLIAGLSGLAVASVYVIVHHTHKRLPARQAVQGDPETDISAPIPMDVAHAVDRMESGDVMTAREVEEERRREARRRGRNRVATYEIAYSRAANSPSEVVTDLPPAELGEILFHQGHFWRVDAIEPAQSREADGRLIVTLTTDEPNKAMGSTG